MCCNWEPTRPWVTDNDRKPATNWKPVSDPQTQWRTDNRWPTHSDPHPCRQAIKCTEWQKTDRQAEARLDWPGLCAARWGSVARRVAECLRQWENRACLQSAPCNSAELRQTQTAPGYDPATQLGKKQLKNISSRTRSSYKKKQRSGRKHQIMEFGISCWSYI